jgi:hypothetical protein
MSQYRARFLPWRAIIWLRPHAAPTDPEGTLVVRTAMSQTPDQIAYARAIVRFGTARDDPSYATHRTEYALFAVEFSPQDSFRASEGNFQRC